jgi:uncharacterized OB-fold protein
MGKIAALEGVELMDTIETPARLDYTFTAGQATSRFLKGIAQKKIFGERCGPDGKVYVPPRGSDPVLGKPTTEQVEVSHCGTVTSFCVVNLQFYGQEMEVPYVCALVLLDGASLAIFALIQEIPYDQVHPGMRVEAVWVDDKDLGPTLESIKYFRPNGEPDAPFESYKEHV